MNNIVLSAQSCSNEVESYFNSVLTLAKSGEKFPVDLDEVWPLCYVQKVKAVQFLTDSGQFYEGEDYILLSQKVKQTEVGSGGHNRQVYMLSVPCMEYLIARKVRAVFEVYRRVFHEFLNMKRMSDDEIVLKVMLILQSRVDAEGTLLAYQAKRERLGFVSWLESESFSGLVKMDEIYFRYRDYCISIGVKYPRYDDIRNMMTSLGIQKVFRKEGHYYFFGSEPCHEN